MQLPLFVNTLISPRDQYVPLLKVDDSSEGEGSALPSFDVRFRNIGVGYWTLQMQITMSFDEAEKMMSLNEYDVDSFKQMVGGSSPFKIVVVYGIAILHLVFSYLAFTNDISFWRQKTSLRPLCEFGDHAGMHQHHLFSVRAGSETDKIRHVLHWFPFLLAAVEASKAYGFTALSIMAIHPLGKPSRHIHWSGGVARDS